MKPFISGHPTPLIAHRGYSLLETENTTQSIQKTFLAGIQWAEVDIQMTLDQQLVVFHDFTLERLAGWKDKVRDKTLEELQNIPILELKTKQKTSKILSFEELLKMAQELYLSLNIEIKIEKENIKYLELLAQILFKILQKYQQIPILISSFSYTFLEIFFSLSKNYRLGLLLCQVIPDWKEKLQKIQAYSLHCDKNIAQLDFVNQAKSLGYSFLVYTVDEKVEANRFFSMGVDSIFSNNVFLLRNIN